MCCFSREAFRGIIFFKWFDVELTRDDVDVRADGLAPRRQAGVVARVGGARARHEQPRRRARPPLLRLEADAAARRVKVQDLRDRDEEGRRTLLCISNCTAACGDSSGTKLHPLCTLSAVQKPN